MPRTTLKDIASEMGYSKNTISLGLRGNPADSAGDAQAHPAVAERLGYRPNAVVSQLMAQLRSARTSRLQAKLALVNANLDPRRFRSTRRSRSTWRAARSRAASLGYDFDRFWLHDPELTAERWLRILGPRGIKGLILVGLMDTNHLPEALEAVWRKLPCVVTGVRTRTRRSPTAAWTTTTWR
jgi:LacI family transcriptional regulator